MKRLWCLAVALVTLLAFASLAWGGASLTMEIYPEKFVEIDEFFYFNIQIKNVGDDTAYNVTLTPTFDSNIDSVGAPANIGSLAADEFTQMNGYVPVKAATTDKTLMTSSMALDYEDVAAVPYTTVNVEWKNRAFTTVERPLDPAMASGFISHFDIRADGGLFDYELRPTSSTGLGTNSDIYTIKTDGTDLTQITADVGCESEPAFSPDGTQVAYKSNRNMGTVPDATYDPLDDYNSDIYVIDLATKADTQLTSDGDCQLGPQFSPDGAYVAFRDDHLVKGQTAGNYGYSRMWMMDADGSNQLMLGDLDMGGTFKDWTPDSQWLVYTIAGYRYGDYHAGPGTTDIYKVKPDGTSNTRLTLTDDYCESHPKVSPDGELILFKLRYNPPKALEADEALAVMDMDGYNGKVLVESDPVLGNDVHKGNWSPDGRWIVFGWETFAPTEYWQATFVIDRRGLYKGNISSGYYERKPMWSPDGSYLAFIDEDYDSRTAAVDDIWLHLFDSLDPDNDLLANWEEDVVGTEQDTFDTDGDTAGDGREFDQGSNPLVADCPGTPVLTATAGDGVVDLSWVAPAKGGAVASYNVYRSEAQGGPYDMLDDGITVLTYTDTSVTNGTTYYYVVVAVDDDDFMGGDSNEEDATPQAAGDDDTDDDDSDDDDSDDDDSGDDDDNDDDGCCGC